MSVEAAPATEAPPSPRERILLTAHALFYRDGIRATGIDRIIAEAGVSKLTFYRQFPSKSGLILEFLDYRHRRWMAWFTEALQRHGAARGKGLAALVPTLREWFTSADYRGCAFINSVGELGPLLPEVLAISRSHKREMADTIASLLPASRQREQDAQAIALLVDGAIVRAQCEPTPEVVLKTLARALKALAAVGA